MSKYELQYLNLLNILLVAPARYDRTGVGTRSLFGYHMLIKLDEGFPLLTTKYVHFKSILYELFWFIRGDTNIKYLNDHKVTIWDEWADENGDLGPIYGYQWRKWPGYNNETYDQLNSVIEEIKRNPYSRRLLVSAWNVAHLLQMKLPPCHVLYQFYVEPDTRKISISVYQRSVDVFLGLPFNIASYALLLHLVGKVVNYKPDTMHYFMGDVHLYLNHQEQAKEQLSRTPYPLPQIEILKDAQKIDDFAPEDIRLINYVHHPKIPAPIAV